MTDQIRCGIVCTFPDGRSFTCVQPLGHDIGPNGTGHSQHDSSVTTFSTGPKVSPEDFDPKDFVPVTPAEAIPSDSFFYPPYEKTLIKRIIDVAEGIRPIRKFTDEEYTRACCRLWSALDDLETHLIGYVGPGTPRPVLDGWSPPAKEVGPVDWMDVAIERGGKVAGLRELLCEILEEAETLNDATALARAGLAKTPNKDPGLPLVPRAWAKAELVMAALAVVDEHASQTTTCATSYTESMKCKRCELGRVLRAQGK